MEPQPESPWKYILIGCAVIVAAAIIAGAATCIYMGKYIKEHGDKFVQGFQNVAGTGMKMAKPEYMKMLSDDHTAKQRENFSYYYDTMADLMAEDMQAFIKGDYSQVFSEFNAIVADQRITVKESTEWTEHFAELLEQKGYGEEGAENEDDETERQP